MVIFQNDGVAMGLPNYFQQMRCAKKRYIQSNFKHDCLKHVIWKQSLEAILLDKKHEIVESQVGTLLNTFVSLQVFSIITIFKS